MKLHCPQCKQLLEAEDSMSGQVINCPACSGDLRVPATAESEPTSSEARPEPRQEATTTSSNPGNKRAEHLPKTTPKDLQLKPADGRAKNLATASLVLGIFSIMAAILISGFVAVTIVLSKKFDMLIFHFVSFALGIGAIMLANKAKLIGTWSSAGSTQGDATAGRICGIIGITIALALSIFML